MAKRFFVAFGLVLLYMAAWAPILFIWILIAGDSDALVALGVLGALVIIIIGFIPYLDFVAKTAFHFPGQGRPISERGLRAMLKDVNRLDAPVMVKEQGNKLVFTWKYVDATWWELLAKAGLKQIYELHVRLNDRKKEATLIDVKKSVAWRAAPNQVRVWGGFFRGVEFSISIGKQWGIKENFELGQVYDYKFSPQEIKNPVMNSILRSGWSVRFGIW
jgi:hypothetical protein